MLVANHLKKVFHEGIEVEAISEIDLKVDKGDFVIITGKSGSGKSTLLYLLSGLETPTDGEVRFHDICLNQLKDKQISQLRREKFGFIFQFYNLIPNLTVKDNILLPLTFQQSMSQGKKEKVDSYIESLGLKEKINSYPYKLSGGQQQRVAIARALSIEPDIIFADEPTGNLDSVTGEDVMEIFQKLNKEFRQTILLVTHDNKIAENYGTRKVTVENGKIVEDSKNA